MEVQADAERLPETARKARGMRACNKHRHAHIIGPRCGFPAVVADLPAELPGEERSLPSGNSPGRRRRRCRCGSAAPALLYPGGAREPDKNNRGCANVEHT